MDSAVTILLVEDDAGDQVLTKRAFAKSKITNDIYVVETGEEALDYLFHRGKYANLKDAPIPSLILLDVNLPKKTGLEVLVEIRKCDKTRKIPIVILTTSRQKRDVDLAYELGANSFISKPIDVPKFLQIVQSLEGYWLQVVRLPSQEEG